MKGFLDLPTPLFAEIGKRLWYNDYACLKVTCWKIYRALEKYKSRPELEFCLLHTVRASQKKTVFRAFVRFIAPVLYWRGKYTRGRSGYHYITVALVALGREKAGLVLLLRGLREMLEMGQLPRALSNRITSTKEFNDTYWELKKVVEQIK